ncbi:EGF-like [Vigna unguiculata]|uniref:EGF-like n=1 Tax=Vigna unguiculata TaxID=3917 RepID=A0A4D6NC79_VIGUN|nr:EGF-like [Vigna unguiculata]
MSMCDGTNSFWCEHGGSCEEIVQGEKYSCKCPDGFGGEHCEHSGAPCGESFCFHNAECLAEAGSKPNFDVVKMKSYAVYDICLSSHKHVQPFEITNNNFEARSFVPA